MPRHQCIKPFCQRLAVSESYYCEPHKRKKRVTTSQGAPLGTRKETQQGYVLIKTEYGWRQEHTVVMERILGRPLDQAESVHHINGNRSDNSEENLELWVGGIRYGQRATDISCPHCGETWL